MYDQTQLPETIQILVEAIRAETGPAITIADFDKFPSLPSGKTIRNKKSAGTIPPDIFIKDGDRRTLVLMDKYLPFWGAGLSVYEKSA
jgi:hypothetical protein